MATSEERVLERERVAIAATSYRTVGSAAEVSWAGIWSGFVVAIATLTVLTAVGMAVGISVLDAVPRSAGNAPEWSVAASLWELGSLVIALFVGGRVSTRTGIFTGRPAGGVHGTAVWLLTTFTLSTLGGIRLAVAGFPVLQQPETGVTSLPQPDATVLSWAAVFVLVVTLLAAIGGAAAGRQPRVIRD